MPSGSASPARPCARRWRKLTSEGLVTRSGGGVPTVSRISVTEIMEILHVRRLLESETARQAASVNASPEPFLAMRAG